MSLMIRAISARLQTRFPKRVCRATFRRDAVAKQHFSRSVRLCIAIVACWVGLGLFGAGDANGQALGVGHDVGRDVQLFVDDELIESKEGVVRRVEPAMTRREPVLLPELPWEYSGDSRRIYLYGTVLYDPIRQDYRMWYLGRMDKDHEHSIPSLYKPRKVGERDAKGRSFAGDDIGDLTLYATSQDGIQWDKPSLGLHEFDGSPANNIMLDLHGASVLYDESAPDPKNRYKMIGFERRYRSIFAYYSEDGIHWKEYSGNPVVKRRNEGVFNVCFDQVQRRYLGYGLVRNAASGNKRVVQVSTSSDFENWTEPRVILRPDAIDDEWVSREGQQGEFYGMTVFPYGRMFLGILHVLRNIGPGPGNPTDGPIDAQLVYSRDGLTWHRSEDRTPVIPRGPEGSFDGGMIMMTGVRPFVHGDEVIAYYTASKTSHGALLKDKLMSIGRASWRLDRFVGLDAGQNCGTVETVPLRMPAGQLEVNADAAGGAVKVEVLFADGRVQPGFSGDDCRALTGDKIRHLVRWNGADLSDAHQPLRLRFRLQRAKIYSFRVVRDGPDGS